MQKPFQLIYAPVEFALVTSVLGCRPTRFCSIVACVQQVWQCRLKQCRHLQTLVRGTDAALIFYIHRTETTYLSRQI